MSDIADALSSASLLIAALALVYGAWGGAIDKEANRSYSPNEATKSDQKKETRAVRDRKALPIAFGCWLTFISFLPRALSIFTTSLNCYGDKTCHYKDIPAIFILTEVFIVGLAIHLTGRFRALSRKLKE